MSNKKNTGWGSFIGWSLTTLALSFFNKRNSSSDSTSEPDTLSVNVTKLGMPIPVILGTRMLKSPITSFWGDFDWKAYTEEYAAHASFNAWPLVLSLIATYIGRLFTVTVEPGQKTSDGAATVEPGKGKDNFVGPLLMSLFLWLLSWLINGRNLKTTIQKGFKYYLGYQQILCHNHPNARLRAVYMNEKKVWSGDEPAYKHIDGSPFVIKVNDEDLFGGVDEGGGFIGELHVYFGGERQNADSWMVNQMKASSIREDLRGKTPAYRPYITVVVPKAYIGKRATIPTMWYEISIMPNSIYDCVLDYGLANVSKDKLYNGITWKEKPSPLYGFDDKNSIITYMNYIGMDDEINDYVQKFEKDLKDGTISLSSLNIPYNDMETATISLPMDKETLAKGYMYRVLTRLKNTIIGEDINPAEVFNELVSNKNWGLHESYREQSLASIIEVFSFLEMEKLGISVLMDAKDQARTVIDNICNHINGFRYADEGTGKVTYKLVRTDYLGKATDTYKDTFVGDNKLSLWVDESGYCYQYYDNIKQVTPSNCKKISFVRQDWSNTVSEISVNFIDRADLYESGTVTSDDIANIEIQNGIKTTKSYDFQYFSTGANAIYAAKREMTVQGYPLATVSLEMNRQFFDVRLGDVFKLTFAPYGISDMVFRVNSINVGDYLDGTVTVDAIEDVFGLAKTTFNYTDPTEWEIDPKYPEGAQYFAFYEMPYEIMKVYYTYVFGFCCQPTPDTDKWSIWRNTTTKPWWVTNVMSKWTAAGRLVYDYAESTDPIDYSGLQFRNLYGIEEYKERMDALPFTGVEASRNGVHVAWVGDEIISFATIQQLPNGNWMLNGVVRGTYDTVPQNHNSLDTIFFMESGHYANVTAGGYVCKAGETADEYYNITTASGTVETDFDDKKIQHLETTRRSERPSVQGNVRITSHNQNNVFYPAKVSGDIKVTWTPRDKTLSFGCVAQSDIKDYFSGSSIVLPSGVSYVTKVYIDGVEVTGRLKISNTDEFFEYSWGDRCTDNNDTTLETVIETYTNDGVLDSYQKHRRLIKWTVPTIVGISDTIANASSIISSLDTSGQIEILPSAYTVREYIDYIDLPVFLLGTMVGSATPGAIVDTTGNYWLPNGTAMLLHDDKTYDVITLPDNYTLRNPFKNPSMTKRTYVRWEAASSMFVNVNADGSVVI